jgi:3-hydroxybutyryl-CoA dehydrogenase
MNPEIRIAVAGRNALADALVQAFRHAERVECTVWTPAFQGPCDLVVETENRDLAVKKQVLRDIETRIAGNIPMLVSTLGISATEAASWLEEPQRLIGFAAFADLAHGELIECALPLQAAPSSVHQAAVESAFKTIGKEVEWIQDETGGVFPRILSMIVNEAAYALMENIASPEDIDAAMRMGTNYPFGPLAWGDRVGLDDVHAVLSGLHRDLGEDRYRPAPLLRKMVLAGWYGQRTGRGFYNYEREEAKELMK